MVKVSPEEVLEEPVLPTKKPLKEWAWFLLLLLGYVIFLFAGAGIFMALEFEQKSSLETTDLPRWGQIKEVSLNVSETGRFPNVTQELREHVAWLELQCPEVNTSLIDLIVIQGSTEHAALLEESCKDLRKIHEREERVYTWTFIDALYFSMTVTTTIGYGHISPSRPWGKVVCMLYAVVGVPLTGILLAQTSDFLGEKTFDVYRSKLSGKKQRSQWFISAATILYLVMGFVVFIFLPALVFTYVEDWTYLDSVYYAFITLTTIGFGDFVSGRDMQPGPAHIVYQILVILWIITSLGYWVMVANFITRALRSKKLHASLLNRAKLVKMMMAHQNDPVFLPQKSKNTLNFMLQLSSMLPVQNDAASDQLHLQEAMQAAGALHPSQRPRTDSSTADFLAGHSGVPGIAALFNFKNGISPTTFNKKICESLAKHLHGKWLTGGAELPGGSSNRLTSTCRLCLMGGCLTCATLLLGAGTEWAPDPAPAGLQTRKKSQLSRTSYSFPEDLNLLFPLMDDPAACF